MRTFGSQVHGLLVYCLVTRCIARYGPLFWLCALKRRPLLVGFGPVARDLVGLGVGVLGRGGGDGLLLVLCADGPSVVIPRCSSTFVDAYGPGNRDLNLIGTVVSASVVSSAVVSSAVVPPIVVSVCPGRAFGTAAGMVFSNCLGREN